MEIKEFYLDLREGPQYAKQNNNIWLLESEMFKDPLKFCVGYDDNDKRELEKIKKDCLEIKESLNKEFEKVYKLIEQQTEVLKDLKTLKIEEQKIIDSYKEMQKEEKEKRKEIKKSKEEISSKNDELGEKIQELFTIVNKKPDKKIFRYHGSEFISGLDSYYWNDISVPT
jgi:DNA repair exonuclease SbcCD ATPase subunit